jgi:hypothetical protein
MTDGPVANWYPDPEVPGGMRYWDGKVWTDHRQAPAVTDSAVVPAVAGDSEVSADGLRWDGTSWLWWDGGKWIPAEHRPADVTPADDSQETVEELPAGRPDIAAAVARMGRTMGIKRELRSLADRLREGETVEDIGRVEFRGHGCMLAVTNKRLLFVREGMVRETVEEMPLTAITTVSSKRRLTNGVLGVTVAGNHEEWPMTSAAHTERVSETIRRVVHDYHEAPRAAATLSSSATPATPSTAAAPDHVGQLRQLAELRDAGIISAEDFEAKKAEILSRM